MKIKRLLSVLICLTLVIGLIPAMSLTVSAAINCSSYYVFMNETENYKVGQIVNIPASRYTADLASSDYGVQNSYTYSFSDSSMVKVSGEKVTFVKEGTLTLTIKHNQKFERTGKMSSHTDTIKIKVSSEPIQTTNIKLDSGAFCGGKEFPEFTVVNEPNCYVEEATFYKEMCDYYVGDKLPSYSAGTTINYVSITLKPKSGYFFGWGGTNDGKSHESTIYTVEYKGKKYIPDVVHDQINSELHVYVDVTFEEGQIYATTFKDLDAPYHYGPLDKTVTVSDSLQFVSVKYTMFNKELTEFKKGDTVGIVVRVKTKDPKNTFNAKGNAYWAEQKMNSVNTKLISSTEAEYTFAYKVGVKPEQIIRTVDLSIPRVYANETLATTATSSTKGVEVKSVTWTPNDASADENKNYTVKIEFKNAKEYVFADDFKDQAVVRINGKPAKLVVGEEEISGGAKKHYATKYYAEATFTPEVSLTLNPDSNINIVQTPTQTVVVGTIVTDTEEDKKEDEEIEKEDKEEEEKEEEKKEEEKKEDISEKEDTTSDKNNEADKKDEYSFPFADVPVYEWYFESVKSAHKMGLINGKSVNIYKPMDNMTYAEAVKLAVCMNILYNGGDPNKDIKNGTDAWYSTYMKYALDKGIIDYDLTAHADEFITRKEYVYIFSKALPSEAFAKKNDVPAGSIPDVKEEKGAKNIAIYKFYRAGILAGVDDIGTFKSDDNIVRAEVAAILIRMMDSTSRVNAPKNLAK